ncbi:MAG: Hsp20/alpha crystallin family protein [Desulfobulbaceae bacterium]|nr:Hsp20/alpha crystallin family protein [Desulfobulbaceae bacterium]
MAKNKEKGLVKKHQTTPTSPFGEMERYFEEFMRNPFSFPSRHGMGASIFNVGRELSCSTDIYEDGDDLVVKAEIPGMTKDDIQVKVSGDTVTIAGEKKQEEKVEKQHYHRVERSFGSFRRSFTLPDYVESDKAEATFKKGVLEIRIPKSADRKVLKITVK